MKNLSIPQLKKISKRLRGQSSEPTDYNSDEFMGGPVERVLVYLNEALQALEDNRLDKVQERVESSIDILLND